jgi:hypothetical protein
VAGWVKRRVNEVSLRFLFIHFRKAQKENFWCEIGLVFASDGAGEEKRISR